MTVTVHKHGGVHEWDISTSEMQEALYVSECHCPEFTALPDVFSGSIPQPSNMRQLCFVLK